MRALKSLVLGSIMSIVLLFSTAVVSSVEVSGAAPDFTLRSSKGSNMKLSEFRGDVVMINFWATWCGPCRQEMPILNDIYLKYRDLGFTLLAVNVEEDSDKAADMIRELKVVFPVLFDTQNKVSELYKVEAMPSTVLVDRNGNMRYLHRGYEPGTEDEYVRQVRELMRE